MGANPFGLKCCSREESTEKVYQMSTSKTTKSLNGLVFEIAYKRLKLKRREKIVLQRLLGFLIRNDKPFPFSRKKLSELTGYSESSLDEALNILETLRLVNRVGFTNRTKFVKGSILNKICTLAQKRINIEQYKKCTLPQKLGKLIPTTPVSGYIKTSLSLKHQEAERTFSTSQNLKYSNYLNDQKCLKKLGLLSENTKELSIDEWICLNE